MCTQHIGIFFIYDEGKMYYPVLMLLLQGDPVHQQGFERREETHESIHSPNPNNCSDHLEKQDIKSTVPLPSCTMHSGVLS